MLHSVLQEKPLVAERTIAHTSHDATGYHLDSRNFRNHAKILIQVIEDHAESR
jgi:hypothetical protein